MGTLLHYKGHPGEDAYLGTAPSPSLSYARWATTEGEALLSLCPLFYFCFLFLPKVTFTILVNVCHQLWTLVTNLCASESI